MILNVLWVQSRCLLVCLPRCYQLAHFLKGVAVMLVVEGVIWLQIYRSLIIEGCFWVFAHYVIIISPVVIIGRVVRVIAYCFCITFIRCLVILSFLHFFSFEKECNFLIKLIFWLKTDGYLNCFLGLLVSTHVVQGICFLVVSAGIVLFHFDCLLGILQFFLWVSQPFVCAGSVVIIDMIFGF